MNTQEDLKEIAAALNKVQDQLHFAEPGWDSYGGAAEWHMQWVAGAITTLSEAIGRLAGLRKTKTGHLMMERDGWSVPDSEDE